MRKKCYMLSIAALLLAACSSSEDTTLNQEPLSQDYIMLRPMTTGTTRGVVTTATNFREFKVKATAGDGVPGDYQTFTDWVKSTDGTVWNMYADAEGTTPDRRLWPATGTLNFDAYAPSNLTDAYTVKNFPANQEDVMVAYETGSKAANLVTGVPLYFRHVMSQISILATNMDTENYEVKVLGVKLVNLKGSGQLTHPSSSTGSAFSWDNYTPWATASLNTPNSYMNKAGGAPSVSSITTSRASQAITLDGSAIDITFGNGPMLVLPQQLTAADLTDVATTDAYLSVLVQIKTKQTIYEADHTTIRFQANEVIYPRQKTATSLSYLPDPTASAAAVGSFGFAAIPINTLLKPGYKYTYTINFFAPNGGGCGWVDPMPTNPDVAHLASAADPDVDLNPGVRNPTDPTKPYDKSGSTSASYNPEYNITNTAYYDGTTHVAPTDNLAPGAEIVNSDRPIYFTVEVDSWTNSNQNLNM